MKPDSLWLILCLGALIVNSGIGNPVADGRMTEHDGLVRMHQGGMGNTDPVPLDIQLIQFIRFYNGALDGQLEPGDTAVFLATVRRLAWLEGMDVALGAIQARTICRMVAAGDAPETIAEELQLFDNAGVEQKTSAVMDMFSSLSEDGQRVVQAHLDSIGTEYFSTSRVMNLPEWARNNSVAFAARLEEQCSQPLPPLRGVYVEDVRKSESTNVGSYSLTVTRGVE